MSNTKVLVNPDGQYCVLQEYNPYKDKATDIETQNNNTEYVRLQDNDICITIDDFRKALELERYARFIKFICFFDGTLTLINALMINPYYIFVGIIYYCGYQGANHYNKSYLQIYMTYEVIEVITKIFIFVHIMKQKYSFILGFSIAIDMYILNIYNKFRNMLPEIAS
jgi:hypothetical protein